MVLSKDLIDKIFLEILPEHIQNDKQSANVSRFKTYYYGYSRSVCCKDPSTKDMKWIDHLERWETFKSMLNGPYCLHH